MDQPLPSPLAQGPSGLDLGAADIYNRLLKERIVFLGTDVNDTIANQLAACLFAALTAYDTQKIKEMYFEGDDDVTGGRKAIMGALNLYLDFINMFMFLLQFLGDRR